MKATFALAAAATALLTTPVFAGPPAKRSPCQVGKAAPRDVKRSEPCRRQVVPPILDPTPMFLASTAASAALVSDLS